MKKYLTLILILLFPRGILHFILRLLGHSISYNSKIGFSIIITNDLTLCEYSKIGHFNYINTYSVNLNRYASIGHFNIFNGPIEILLQTRANIYKLNYFTSGNLRSQGSKLILGENTGVTARNHFDLTRSISFGNNTQLGGISSQFWTHGYIHDKNTSERFRVDGEIVIRNNVYIGSGVIVNPGVEITSGVHIGSNSCVSKSLLKSGMYVSQPLRFIERDYEDVKKSLIEILEPNLIEKVYEKVLK
jgi:acetyltransferase-like isoleucine patch superfamily enzyme